MNNKGQTLVLFVLLLPLIFIFIAMVLETGSLLIIRKQVDDEIKQTIKYGLKLEDTDPSEVSDKMKKMLIDNLGSDIKCEIKIATSDIHVEVIKKYHGLFPTIVKQDYEIKRNFRGYLSNNKIKIEKE